MTKRLVLMKADKKVLLFLMVCTCCFQAIAQHPKEHVYLKDGSMYSGYVCKQHADSKIDFLVDFGRVVAKKCQVSENDVPQFYGFDSLDARWKEYSKLHDLIQKEGNKEGIMLYNNSLCKELFTIEAETDSTITYAFFALQPNVESFQWGVIDHLEYDPVNVRNSNFLESIFEFKDGSTLKGQMVGQKMGLAINVLVDGRKIEKKLSDIRSIKKGVKDPGQEIQELIPYLEQIIGTSNSNWGLIIEKDEKEMKILELSGEIKSFPNSEIKNINRKLNNDYAPITLSANLSDSLVVVSGVIISFSTVKKILNGDIYSFPKDYKAAEIQVNAKNQVELNFVVGLKEKLVVFDAKPSPENKKTSTRSKEAMKSPQDLILNSFDIHDLADFKENKPIKTYVLDNLGLCRSVYKLEVGKSYVVYNRETKKAFMIKIVE